MEEKKKIRGERSSFAVTCSLLSQFLKEHRNLGKLGIDRLHCSPDKEKDLLWPPTTMNLFPGSNVSADNRNESDLSEKTATMPMHPPPQLQDKDAIFKAPNTVDQKDKEINGQLTIFYDGKVMVFNDFPAKKVRDLMVMASKPGLPKPCLPNSSCLTPSLQALQHEQIASVDLTMPIARRASLHRFLEKRKDRINSQAPYIVHSSSKMEEMQVKSEKRLAWLSN